MSKLDELLWELCPDGVQVFRLEEIAHYAKTRIDCKTISEDNYVGVENLLQNKAGKTKATSVPTTGMVIAYQKNDILIGNIRPYLRKVWLADCEGGTNGDVLTVQIEDTEKVLPQFLYYVLSSEKFFLYDIQNSKGAKMPRGSKDAVMKFEVPLPPLEVQREIVRMLDSYTECVVELQRQLTAELTARKMQYEFYRDKLLNFKTNIAIRKFGSIAKIQRGASPRPIKAYITDSDEGVNWIKIGDVKPGTKYITDTEEKITAEGARKSRYVKEGDFILSNSMSFGRPYIVKKPGCIHDGWLSISEFSNVYLPDFLYHLLSSSKYQSVMKQKASFGGAIQNLNADIVKDLDMPIVPMDVQKRVVSVLDNFDSICSDLNIGLPAEIEARQKQYEYYRDKLLTFAETGNTILSRAEQSRAEQSRAEH
jgi:type I restriction enzyme S subunit